MISFVISDISKCGGTERITLLIAGELLKLGYPIKILSIYGSGKPYFDYNKEIEIEVLNKEFEQKLFSAHPKYTILKLRLWCLFYRPNVIIDTSIMMGNLTIPAIHGLGIKHVAWDNFSYEYFKQVHHEQVALEKLKKNGSHLITLTACDRELFINEQHVEPTHVHHIPNPVTISQTSTIDHYSKKVISAGRFAYEKGFDLLLKAWKVVESQVDDWTLEIWGDTGTDTGNVWNTYYSLDLKHASLHPATNNLMEKFKEAAIYVLPSRHEGFGLVLLEAAAMSLPLIAFDCPNGPREIIKDGKNGLLIENGNVEELSSAIIKMIKDLHMRKQMGTIAFQSVKEYSVLEIVTNDWVPLLNILKINK